MNACRIIIVVLMFFMVFVMIPNSIDEYTDIADVEDEYQSIVSHLNYSLTPDRFIEQIVYECNIAYDEKQCVKIIYDDTQRANEFAQHSTSTVNPYIITNTDLNDRMDELDSDKTILIGVWILSFVFILFAFAIMHDD